MPFLSSQIKNMYFDSYLVHNYHMNKLNERPSRLKTYLKLVIYFDETRQQSKGLCTVAASTVALSLLDTLSIPYKIKANKITFVYRYVDDLRFLCYYHSAPVEEIDKICRFIYNITNGNGRAKDLVHINHFSQLFALAGHSAEVGSWWNKYVTVKFTLKSKIGAKRCQ